MALERIAEREPLFEIEVNPYPGLFIDIEGLDGSGSTTQMYRVAEDLRRKGLKVEITKEPTQGPIGSLIRMALTNRFEVDRTTLQLLFVADRFDHLETWIVPRLKEGTSIITDRYLWSTLAYAPAEDRDYLYRAHQHPRMLLPDLTVFLKIPPKIALERIAKGRFSYELFEEEELLHKTWEQYEEIARYFPENIRIIDGMENEYVVTTGIMIQVKSLPKFKALTQK